MTILGDELRDDPLARGYAGMTDKQAADDINTVYRPAPISHTLVREYLLRNGLFSTIEIKTRGVATDKDASIDLLAWVDPIASSSIDFQDNKGIVVSIAALVGFGVLTATQQTELLALGDNRISRAQELRIGEQVTEGRVKQERGN